MRLGFGWKEGEAGVSGKQSTEFSGEQSELGDPVSVRAGRKILKTGTPSVFNRHYHRTTAFLLQGRLN